MPCSTTNSCNLEKELEQLFDEIWSELWEKSNEPAEN